MPQLQNIHVWNSWWAFKGGRKAEWQQLNLKNTGETFGQRLSRERFAHERHYKAWIFLETGQLEKNFMFSLVNRMITKH